jgi:ubiquinone/menaquinone biosynthesis C-methylase UbiE
MVDGPLSKREPWDLVADGYVDTTMHMLAPYSGDAIAWVKPIATDRVVDVAAGPGTLALQIAPRVAQVDAIDFSETMVSHLQRRLASAHVGNVNVQVGDGQSLPFASQTYDLAFSMFGLMFFPDRHRGFTELARVLKPGGRAVVSCWVPLSQSPSMQLLFGALKAGNPEFPAPQDDPSSLDTADKLAHEMKRAGFVDVQVRPISHPFQITDVREFWHDVGRGVAPLVMMRRQIGEEAWAKLSTAAIAYLEHELKLPAAIENPGLLGLATMPS